MLLVPCAGARGECAGSHGSVQLVLHVCLFLPLGNYFEPVWGSREFAKAVLFVNVSCSISILLLSLVGYIFTLRDEIL